ncbi:MAG: hypothetical protein NT019_01475 [Candidatus Adlerbacteria bacterium]|nr:hypothetical protein [Candidatus Adlerbacteria bacterium]
MSRYGKRLAVGIATLVGAFLSITYFVPTNTPVFVDQAPQVDALPTAWVQELFEKATLHEIKQKSGIVLGVWKVAPWNDRRKKHELLRFDIRLVADGIVYTYTHGIDSERDSLLAVRTEYPNEGISLPVYADHKNNELVKLLGGGGTTALSLPFNRRNGYKDEHNEWKSRFNAALLALAEAVNLPSPEGVWQ